MFVVKDIRDELIEYKCTNNKDIVIKLFKNVIKLKLKNIRCQWGVFIVLSSAN